MSTDGLHSRSVAFQLRDAGDGDGRTLEGYAAVFNSPTMISDYLGEYEETIAPGAFKRTLQAKTPILMFEHGKHPLIGSMPIGSISELREDDRGLFVRARLFDNWMINPLRDAINDRAVDGMSFRFSVPEGKETWTRDRSQRTVREVKLYELGPVVFPAYADTTLALRSLEEIVPDVFHREEEPPVDSGTSEEPAAERSTSDEPASSDDPAPSHSSPSTIDERRRVARQIEASRRGAGKR